MSYNANAVNQISSIVSRLSRLISKANGTEQYDDALRSRMLGLSGQVSDVRPTQYNIQECKNELESIMDDLENYCSRNEKFCEDCRTGWNATTGTTAVITTFVTFGVGILATPFTNAKANKYRDSAVTFREVKQSVDILRSELARV
ncbi:hypothetical protein WA158_005887 [Blastocystis sp. Blastoise]